MIELSLQKLEQFVLISVMYNVMPLILTVESPIRAKPEKSGDAKPRVLQQDSRVAEEMSHISWSPAIEVSKKRSSSAEDWALFCIKEFADLQSDGRLLIVAIRMFSERAKPEKSGDAKPRVLQQDSRVAEEMSHISWNPVIEVFKERSSSAEDRALFYLVQIVDVFAVMLCLFGMLNLTVCDL